MGRQLVLLARERVLPLLQVASAPFVLLQRDHGTPIGLRQPLHLLDALVAGTPQLLPSRLQILRQPLPACGPGECLGDLVGMRKHGAQVLPHERI